MIRTTIIVFCLGIRLLDNSIEILMKPIKQISNELSRIMLIVA